MKVKREAKCYYPNSFLKAKQKCLGKAVIFLDTIDPPAEGPYAAAEMPRWKRCSHSGSV